MVLAFPNILFDRICFGFEQIFAWHFFVSISSCNSAAVEVRQSIMLAVPKSRCIACVEICQAGGLGEKGQPSDLSNFEFEEKQFSTWRQIDNQFLIYTFLEV